MHRPKLSIVMFLSAATLVVANESSAIAQSLLPPPVPCANCYTPPVGTTWQWQLTGAVDTSLDVQMYDVDLFDVPQSVIDALRTMRHSESEYYRIRGTRPRGEARRAARIIYLNKTGYNGLYRVNRAGQFNVPFGRYENPQICNEPRLRAAAEALRARGVSLKVADFERDLGRR